MNPIDPLLVIHMLNPRPFRPTFALRATSFPIFPVTAGDVWTDPPSYHPLVVWPAYVFGHRHMFENPAGDVEEGQFIGDMTQWEKDDEQRRGGWAEDKVKELEAKEETGASAENLQNGDKGKGKAKADEQEGTEVGETAPISISRTLHEFRPKEGDEGMNEMVGKALGIIFDTVKSMP